MNSDRLKATNKLILKPLASGFKDPFTLSSIRIGNVKIITLRSLHQVRKDGYVKHLSAQNALLEQIHTSDA